MRKTIMLRVPMIRLIRCRKIGDAQMVIRRHLPEAVSDFVDRGAEYAALTVENGGDGVAVSNYGGRTSDKPVNE